MSSASGGTKVRWTRRALRNLDKIAEQIAQDRPMAARQVVQRVEKAVHQLTDFPDLGRRGRVAGTRELVISKTPVIVAYRRRNGNLEILAVIHSARRWPEEF